MKAIFNKVKKEIHMEKEITFKQLSKTASKLLDYIVELNIPEGELVEFRRDVVKEHTGLSYGRQVKGLRELCDSGLIQVRFYGRVREIAVNHDRWIGF